MVFPIALGGPPFKSLITNPGVSGAVAGSPGTLPTNWAHDSLSTETRTLALPGAINGQIPLDFQMAGGNMPTTNWTITPHANPGFPSGIAVNPGDRITIGVYYKTVTDDAQITNVILELLWGNSSNAEISRIQTTISKAASSLTLYTAAGAAPALTTQIIARVRHNYTGTPSVTYRFDIGPWRVLKKL